MTLFGGIGEGHGESPGIRFRVDGWVEGEFGMFLLSLLEGEVRVIFGVCKGTLF